MKKQLHGPVVYLDPITMLPTCGPKDCKEKFNTKKIDVRTINEKWIGGPYTFLYHYTLCDECNKQMQTTQDKTLTNDSVRRSKNNKGIDPEMKE
jgi:hypothetical protein